MLLLLILNKKDKYILVEIQIQIYINNLTEK